MKSLQSSTFSRIKFGIGAEFPKGRQSNYVLGEWSSEELESLEQKIEYSIQMIKSFCTLGISRTMNEYNKR